MPMANIKLKFWPWLVGSTFGLIVTFMLLKYQPWQQLERAGLQIEYNQGQGYASVFLDDRYLEKAPLAEKNIQAGEYILKIVPDDQDLAEFSTPITLEKGTLGVVIYLPGETAAKSAAIIYELQKQEDLKNKGSLVIESYPEGANLVFADQGVELTPFQFDQLEPGDYQFSLSLDGYQEQQQNAQVLAGYKTIISVQLAKAVAKLETADEISEELLDDQVKIEDKSSNNQLEVLIKKTGFLVDGEEVLRVRAASSSSGAELGFAKSESLYPYLEIEGVASDSAWLPIWFENQTGWVSSQFAELKNPTTSEESSQSAELKIE